VSVLRLTPPQRESVQAAIRVLLTPGAFESLDAWRRAVNRATRPLLDADMATFLLALGTTRSAVSEEIGRIGEYVPQLTPLATQTRLLQRAQQLVVCDRESLWGLHLPEMLRSAYYNEFVRPIRAFDGINLTVAGGDLYATLHFNHERERGPRFGARGLALLWLLEPAFRVGSRLAVDYFARAANGAANGAEVDSAADAAHGAPGQPDDARRVPDEPPSRASCVENGSLSGSVSVPVGRMGTGGPLTAREHQVAALLAARRSNQEIAELLAMSPLTAKRHTENILQKLGLSSRREVERVIMGW